MTKSSANVDAGARPVPDIESALSKARLVHLRKQRALSIYKVSDGSITNNVIPSAAVNADNPPPPNHTPPLTLYSLLHRLHRLSAPDLPLPIPPLLPPPAQDPDRARNATGTLRQSIQHHHSSRAGATISTPDSISMGASRPVSIHESVPRVPEIPHGYSDLSLSRQKLDALKTPCTRFFKKCTPS